MRVFPVIMVLMFQISIYLGIGVLTHLIFVGDVMDWRSAWTLSALLAWPVIWGAVILVIGLIIAGVVFLAQAIR